MQMVVEGKLNVNILSYPQLPNIEGIDQLRKSTYNLCIFRSKHVVMLRFHCFFSQLIKYELLVANQGGFQAQN